MCVYARTKEEKKSVSERQEVAPVITTMKNNNVMHSLSLSLAPFSPLLRTHPLPDMFLCTAGWGGASSVDLWRGIAREYFRRRGDDDAPSRLSPFSHFFSHSLALTPSLFQKPARERDLIHNPATALGCEILSTLIKHYKISTHVNQIS